MKGTVNLSAATVSRRAWYLLLVLPSLLFVVYPMGVLLATSFSEPGTGSLTLEHYERIFLTPRYLARTWNTLSLSFTVTLVSVFVGVAISLYLWRRTFPGKALLANLLVIPYMTPHYIIALAAIYIFGNNGVLAYAMRRLSGDPALAPPVEFMFTYHGIVAVFVFNSVAMVVFLTLAFLAGIPKHFEDAARSLGASTFTIMRRVILPMAAPAIAGSAVLVFSRVMVDYIIVQTIGGVRYSTLAVEVANRFFGYIEHGVPAALASLLSVLTMALMYTYLYWSRWRGRR